MVSDNFSKQLAVGAAEISHAFHLNDWLREKTSSPNFIALLVVAMLHLAALVGITYNFQNSNNLPVLSFSVTTFDVSASSSNVVSSAASSASHEKSQAKSMAEEKTLTDAKSSTAAAAQALPKNDEAKNKSQQSHDSIAQSAVIAPTTPASFDAANLNNPSPVYPPMSRRLEEQGTVVLKVLVGVDGKAQNVAIKNSSGFDRLDNAAVETVKNWRFIAAKNHEKLVPSFVQVPIKFVLEK